MKIQGLKRDDVDIIKWAFSCYISEQALMLSQRFQANDVDTVRSLWGTIGDTIKTFEKINNELKKYN